MRLLGIAVSVLLMVTALSAQTTVDNAPFGSHSENLGNVKFEFIRIPTGSFVMGDDQSPYPEEKPAHRVAVNTFFIGRYEITREQWNIVAQSLPRVNNSMRTLYIGPSFGRDIEKTNPASEIFLGEILEFCARLSRFLGKTIRLPSESEWEYSCRAGTTTEYSWGNSFDQTKANISFGASTDLPVGKMGYANAWGLYDMHGNVAEVCADYWHNTYSGSPLNGAAWLTGGDSRYRVSRGGAFRQKSELGRSAYRRRISTDLRTSWDGFRVVLEGNAIIGASTVAVTSAASFFPQNLSPNSLGTLFGQNLATETKVAESLPLPTTLAGCSVFIKDVLGEEHLAKLLYVSPTQINFQMPADLPLGIAQIYAVLNGNIHSSGTLNITRVSPGLFSADATGKGFAAAVVQRIKRNGESTYEPITRFDTALNRIIALPIDVSLPDEEVFLALFGTGIRGRSSLANVTAQIGATNVEVLYAGVQPDFVGLDQINIRLPRSLSGSGEVIINVNVDGTMSNAVGVFIK